MKKPDFFSRTKTVSDGSLKKIKIRSFLFFVICLAVGITGWKWLNNQPQDQGVLHPLRKALQTNEQLFHAVLSPGTTVKSYPLSEAVKAVRVNGDIGLKKDSSNIKNWHLQVIAGVGDTLRLTLDDLKKLPKKDVIFDFKCIEGWDQVTHWAGVPVKTFLDYYHLGAAEKMQYAGLQTPDKKYYVGIDMRSFLLPQTILCYEMNGKPLPLNQGYPLRLIIPVKYGIKHLKCIGTLFFSNQKPPDYWAEHGYDYYAGL